MDRQFREDEERRREGDGGKRKERVEARKGCVEEEEAELSWICVGYAGNRLVGWLAVS